MQITQQWVRKLLLFIQYMYWCRLFSPALIIMVCVLCSTLLRQNTVDCKSIATNSPLPSPLYKGLPIVLGHYKSIISFPLPPASPALHLIILL